MSGLRSRNKGKRAEREVVKLIQPVVTEVYQGRGIEVPALERNLMQSHKGGYDVVGLDWLALEVKHHEQMSLTTWWRQTLNQTQPGQEPVLFYRKNRVPWRVRMMGHLVAGRGRVLAPVDIEVSDFLSYLEVRLVEEMQTIK